MAVIDPIVDYSGSYQSARLDASNEPYIFQLEFIFGHQKICFEFVPHIKNHPVLLGIGYNISPIVKYSFFRRSIGYSVTMLPR